MKENYNLVQKMRQKLMDKIQNKIDKNGVESDHMNAVVIKLKETQMLQNDPSPRGISELGRHIMIDTYGYHYQYENLSVDDLALLVDTL